MIFKKFLITFLASFSTFAYASPDIQIFSQAGFVGYVTINPDPYRGPKNNFGTGYLTFGQTKTFDIVDPNPLSTYSIHVEAFDLASWNTSGWKTASRIPVLRREFPVCIKLYGSIFNPQYAKVDCNTW